eukprot:6375430-Alexandrium_andersonii.AAC.1
MRGLAFLDRSTSASRPSRPARRRMSSGMGWSALGRLATGSLLTAIRLSCLIPSGSDFSPVSGSPASLSCFGPISLWLMFHRASRSATRP